MNISVMRSDRRKNPEQVAYEFLTFEECKNLASESHCHILDNNGRIAQVKITSVKTWKTRPNEIEVHCKFGMYEYFTVRIDRQYTHNKELVRIVPLIEHDEMREIRRQYINARLHINYLYGIKNSQGFIKAYSRLMEKKNFGRELKAYE